MHHPRTLSALALAASLSLLLAACGGGNAPTASKQPPAAQQPADEDATATVAPVQGGTIPVPADATAANEFVVTGIRARAFAQALSIDTSARIQTASAFGSGFKVQAVTDEMRMLLTVTRSRSGVNIGKKKASLTFVWGNETEKIAVPAKGVYNYEIATYKSGQSVGSGPQSTTGPLVLEVKSPDFQAKTTKSTPYFADSGTYCATVRFSFETSPKVATPGYVPLLFDNNSGPTGLTVCEGATEEAAEKLGLESATKGLEYTGGGSVLPASWNYVKYGPGPFEPTDEQLKALTGAPSAATVGGVTFETFIAPLIVLPPGDAATWNPAQKAQAATAKKYTAFKKQMEIYYEYKVVRTVATSPLRDDIYVIGQNGFGFGGMHTIVIRNP